MKFLFVNTHFLPDRHYGGVVESGSRLFFCLRKMGDFRLATVSANPGRVLKTAGPGSRCYKSYLFHRFAFSSSAVIGLWRDVREADAVYVNGIFTWPVTLAQLYCVALGRPFIAAVRGGLRPWALAHRAWKKWLYVRAVTLPLLRRAAFVLVTSEQERDEISKLGFRKAVLIKNGADCSAPPGPSECAALPENWNGRFVFLFMGRTDREKGLDILVSAYSKFRSEFGREKNLLSVVGPDTRGYFRSLGLDLEAEGIERVPGSYGPEKSAMLSSAGAVILPSYTENFGNVVAEALACETPVITTTGTPWAEIEKVGCGLYVKPEAEALYQAMRAMYLKTPEERREMGRRGREYVLKNFNWEDKARELFEHLKKLVPAEKL
ncbi:MAG TPA: glycosyltransferase [Elusimicrobiales bacterium]|nr:glycosyltransferase [Elusimicrobiales bacterium]